MDEEVQYSPYDLFRELISRVGWASESDRMGALDSVKRWEDVNLFGNMALIVSCGHDDIRTLPRAGTRVCANCGKRM